MSKKAEEIYRTAAKRLEEGSRLGACAAIATSLPFDPEEVGYAINRFSHFFKPDFLENNQFWWPCPQMTLYYQEERALALLFMAEMAATGDL